MKEEFEEGIAVIFVALSVVLLGILFAWTLINYPIVLVGLFIIFWLVCGGYLLVKKISRR